ncbi:hypothetical protein GGP41_006435 [Bipolaris sorokiniana]|uniref:Uncharacterized protein n=2 Tax=Cochliobolus sativus TaxID=45130 RepID=A0A8H5ZJW3_COCSA|nr:uncharacterized protein COCSADRAFT_24239 [Bipolaris sorokiniana ND90Pr]EMD66100.1 hypothetical protein COCSADRAFT_24239 [Bipolaris sorokiniana ND90Pr]KAF5849455.1 hypothetical protein GGP41_006435 [Bipolaris sorokiniana]
MSSTRKFPTVEIEAKDDMANEHTTNSARANNTSVPALPRLVTPSSAGMPLSDVNIGSDTPRLASPLHTPSTPGHFINQELNPTSFSRSPTLVSSIFPTELPLRTPPRPSLINRVFSLSPPSTHAARAENRAPCTFHTPDIELGGQEHLTCVLQQDERAKNIKKIEKVKFVLLLMGGTTLCLAMGIMVYLVVKFATEDGGH